MKDSLASQLAQLRAASLDRHLREIENSRGAVIQISGKRLINFASNDYLGLAQEPSLVAAAAKAIEEFGVGAGASRLITGTHSIHLRLEQALAQWKGTEAALVFSSGYATALGMIPALVGKSDIVILDKLCHASLIDGARLSGATLRVFPHNQLKKLEHHLDWARRDGPEKRVLIVTESVFSMDGDRARLREIVELKNRFDAVLMLDEAHAAGVIGPQGRGLAAEERIDREVEIQMGTLSKAFGVSGGYICGSRTLIDWLINRGRPFIFSTAPPPALAGAALAALELISSARGDGLRHKLWKNIHALQTGLSLKSESAILPLIVGEEKAALEFSKSLQAGGFFVPAIRYPTVAKGSARLRIAASAAHEPGQIAGLVEAIKAASAEQPKLRRARSSPVTE